MMRFHRPISNLTFFWSAENEYNQFSSVIFAHSIIQENWKIELAEPCTTKDAHFRNAYKFVINFGPNLSWWNLTFRANLKDISFVAYLEFYT